MPATQPRKLFLNLPVQDVARSKAFFTKLGFAFNPQFEDASGACMILSEEGYVMIMERQRFQGFAKRPVPDPSQTTSALYALSAGSRAEVDGLVHAALAAGGAPAAEPQDHGFMYGWSFFDPDGHHWEVFWMDPKGPPEAQ